MTETRKQRTPAQLIAETTAKLEKLRIRQAKQDAQSNPALAPLFDQLEEQRKIIREANKGLGKGPQSFAARIAKHNVWIDKITTEQNEATMDLESAEVEKELIEQQIQAAIANLNTNSNTASN
tara:strand:+ start:1167 stop:1535 length:369 start_codon:yes stop_codon:yes gene_type:complete